MKKLALLFVGVIAFAGASYAQMEISPMAGYTFGQRFHNARIGEGMSWGLSAAYPIHRFASLELSYMGQQGEAESTHDGRRKHMDLMSSYVLLGLVKNMPVSQKVSLFGGFGAGLAIYSPRLEEYQSATKMGVGLKAGAKIWLTNSLGIVLQANAHFPVTSVDADVWWTYGGGPDAGLSTSVPFTQFGFSGGLVYRFGTVVE